MILDLFKSFKNRLPFTLCPVSSNINTKYNLHIYPNKEVNISTLLLNKCLSLFGFPQFFHQCLFSDPGSDVGSHIAFSAGFALF